jgi:hypothetical protein
VCMFVYGLCVCSCVCGVCVCVCALLIFNPADDATVQDTEKLL